MIQSTLSSDADEGDLHGEETVDISIGREGVDVSAEDVTFFEFAVVVAAAIMLSMLTRFVLVREARKRRDR